MSARRLSRLDLDDPAFVADPYPSFHAERARGPVSWHEPSETWLVVDHAACSQALRDRRLGRIWHDRQPAAVFEPFNLLHRNQMMENEPPNHSRLRRKVSAAFARGHVERMRPRVIDLGATLLDDVAAADGSEFDALADFAEPLPVLVIAELLGAPRSDIDRLRAWSQAIVRMYEPSISPQVQAEALAASQEFADYMRELIRRPSQRPRRRPAQRSAAGPGGRRRADGRRGAGLGHSAAQRRPRGIRQRVRQRVGRAARAS